MFNFFLGIIVIVIFLLAIGALLTAWLSLGKIDSLQTELTTMSSYYTRIQDLEKANRSLWESINELTGRERERQKRKPAPTDIDAGN